MDERKIVCPVCKSWNKPLSTKCHACDEPFVEVESILFDNGDGTFTYTSKEVVTGSFSEVTEQPSAPSPSTGKSRPAKVIGLGLALLGLASMATVGTGEEFVAIGLLIFFVAALW